MTNTPVKKVTLEEARGTLKSSIEGMGLLLDFIDTIEFADPEQKRMWQLQTRAEMHRAHGKLTQFVETDVYWEGARDGTRRSGS